MIEYVAMAVVAIVILVVLFLAIRRRRLLNKAHPTANARQSDRVRSEQESMPENTQLYVGNVSYKIAEPEIEAFFSNYGEIEQVKLIRDRRSGRSKGFAFVTFDDLKAAKKAIKAHGAELAGRPLTVRYAKQN